MKVQQAVAQMHAQGLLDEREIYAYAQADSAIGGALGAMMNIVLINCQRKSHFCFQRKY